MPRMMLKIARGGLCGSSERSVLPTHEEETPLCCGEPRRGPAPLLLLCGPGLDLLTPSLDAHPSHAPHIPETSLRGRTQGRQAWLMKAPRSPPPAGPCVWLSGLHSPHMVAAVRSRHSDDSSSPRAPWLRLPPLGLLPL